MKIIQPGRLPENDPIRMTCRHCRAIFEFHQIEARRVSDQRDGDFWRLDCPCCNREVIKKI